jgi:hypothetical protein
MSSLLGFILYEGPSLIGDGDIICVATLESSNIKTGNMVQVWILPKDQDPLDALHAGNNESACGSCPLQGTWNSDLGKMENRVCYVNIGQAPKAVCRSYRAGRYPIYDHGRHSVLFRSREIRIGAYGDPAALPTALVRYLAAIGNGWTGYSHQLFWIDQRRANALARYLMVSCHTPAQHAEARRRGWRSFVAVHPKQKRPENAIECPNYTHGVQCADCQLCQGTSKRAKDIYVIAHGKVGANLPIVQQLQGESL